MRLLVVSDTHRHWQRMYDVLVMHPEADLVLHLGDIVDDFDNVRAALPMMNMRCVSGNCDYGSALPSEGLDELGGKRIFFTHGDQYQVKRGTDLLESVARQRGAQICLYGHTHIAETHYTDGLYVMNPGSLGNPRNGSPTYGIIDIVPAGVAMNIARYR